MKYRQAKAAAKVAVSELIRTYKRTNKVAELTGLMGKAEIPVRKERKILEDERLVLVKMRGGSKRKAMVATAQAEMAIAMNRTAAQKINALTGLMDNARNPFARAIFEGRRIGLILKARSERNTAAIISDLEGLAEKSKKTFLKTKDKGFAEKTIGYYTDAIKVATQLKDDNEAERLLMQLARFRALQARTLGR